MKIQTEQRLERQKLQRPSGPLRSLATARVHVDVDVRERGVKVQVNEGGLERVLFNLVANARDAIVSARPGGGRVEIVVRAAVPEDDVPPDFVVLEVADDGCGMDARTRAPDSTSRSAAAST